MITIPEPTQEEIDRRFDLAVKLHKEHLLSKTGKMYPFNHDNLQEAIVEMSDEQKVTLAARLEIGSIGLISYLRTSSNDYWTKCADEESLFVVQKNFDPKNMR